MNASPCAVRSASSSAPGTTSASAARWMRPRRSILCSLGAHRRTIGVELRERCLMGRYEQVCAEHEWRVPERYNIAADCCDKHPRDKLAMVHERHDGLRRELTWGELQDLSNRAANLLEAHGVERGDRVCVVLPPTPETAAVFFGTWKLGAILLSMSVLYGDEGIAHRLNDSQPKVLVTDAANAPRFLAGPVPVLELSPELLAE